MRLQDLQPNALAELRCPTALAPAALAELSRSGFCVVPQWLSPAATEAVLLDTQSCDAAGLPRRAGVRAVHAIDDDTRRSSILPLYPPPRPSAGSVDVRLALSEAVRRLGDQLEAGLPGLPALSPFGTELAYLFYPAGGFYLRHIDVPATRAGWTPLGRSPEDGGSFSGAATRREVSMLLYLHANWDRAWGGSLRISVRDEGGGGDEEQGTESYVDVVPEGGTLVLMRSDRVPHEVLETRRPRNCLVGWFRQER